MWVSLLFITVLSLTTYSNASDIPKVPGPKLPKNPKIPGVTALPAAMPPQPKPQAPPPTDGPLDDGPPKIPPEQQPDLRELAFKDPSYGTEIGCSYDVFFGDDKYLLRGLDYCAMIKCGYNGNRTNVGNVAFCQSVKKKEVTNPHDIQHNKNTIFTVFCNCPEIGHTVAPDCGHQIPISFKMVPRPAFADCVHDYGNCGGGKYCFLSSGKIQCPSSCFLFTNYREGMITIQIQYNCCKNV